MPTAELTVEMPVEELDFLRAYAKAQGTTVATLMRRYAQALRNAPRRAPHPANVQLTGTVPSDLDAREIYRQHIAEKHR